MGVVIETCVKHPGGSTRIRGTDIWGYVQCCHAWLNLYLVHYSMAGHQRTADTPADGGRADTPAGGGQADTGGGAILRIGIHAYAMGEGGMRMEPQRGGRERCINTDLTVRM